MATKSQLISDIELRISKGKPSDDFEVDRRQIGFQIDTIRAMLIKQQMQENVSTDLSDYITLFEAVDVNSRDKVADDGGSSIFFYSTLPGKVLSLPNDGGVVSIETQGGTEVTRMKPTDRLRFKNLKFGKPTACSPAYYRIKDEVFYEGGSDNWKNNGVANMYLILEEIEDDGEDYPVPSEVLPLLLETVTKQLLQQMYGHQVEDLSNDGAMK